MASQKKMPGWSLRTKVLVPVFAVMILLLTVTMLIVNSRFKKQAETNSRQQLNAAKVRFQQSQVQHKIYLQRRFESLAKEPVYRAAFLMLHTETTRDQLSRMFDVEGLARENVAFIFFAPQKGVSADEAAALVQRQIITIAPEKLISSCKAAAQITLQGEAQFDTVAVEDQLFNVVSIPIYDNNSHPDEVVGALVFGEQITWNVAQEFSVGAGAHSCTVLIAGEHVIASTLADTNTPPEELVGIFRRLIRQGAQNSAPLDDEIVNGEHYFCAAGNFVSLKDDTSLGYLLFSSYEEQLTALAQTKRMLLVASLITILISSVVVRFFVNRATEPLLELRDSAEAVGRGDFSQRVPVRSRDECGELAVVFNRMTENIQQSQAQLQQTVNTLKTTQAQLVQSEKLSAVGEFVAGVAHELNNPLAAVMGFAELLKGTNADEKQKRHLDLIYKSSQRCQKIVQSLLSFARRHQPERKPVAVNKLIEDVLEIVAYQLRSSNVEVACRPAPNLPLVLADGHQVQQVLLNLINNARQAIEAHQAGGQIIITTQARDGVLRISIQDNGPGIAPENLSRIFDPFFTTKEVGKGTGLGLSLCYGLIKEHGGNINVTSQPGAGATFTIELPATAGTSETDKPAAAHEPIVNPTEGAGKKILLVDDEDILLEMVRDDLLRHGYEIVCANNGEAALRELHEHKVDAICCDIKMPGLNGRQLYDWIRSTRPQFARRIVFMTGDVINESLQSFLEQENLQCLNKPFALRDLREAIQNIFRENPARR
jgi:signal transduction histidine kinase/ActR/RegA family two-component response regulator